MGHGADVIKELTTDHREADGLFGQIQAATAGTSERRLLLDQLTIELVRHSVAEEQHLYPAHLTGGDAIADDELADHAHREERADVTTAREIMTPGTECIGAEETVLQATEKMTELGVGTLPTCGTDKELKGMRTDRDIVVKGLGKGKDPAQTKAGELAQGEAVTIGADDVEEILATMGEHKIRRLPVIDGHDLVGMVAQADVARALPDPQVGDLLNALSTD